MRSIVLLRSETQKLTSIEKFLESRGFKITTFYRLHDAIYFITVNRPDFALFSTEMIPADSVWLFDVLKQLTAVVLFAERITAKNLTVCTELKGHYLLEPPLTPLGFEQILRRIDRDHRRQSHDPSLLDKTHMHIMSALSDMALKTLCTPKRSAAGAERVQKISKVTCFRVQTRNLSGFFVVAYGENRSLDPNWASHFQTELKNYLTTFDEDSALENPEEMMIAEVRFPEWSKEQAQFMRQATHNDAELVLAFFKDTTDLRAKKSLRADHVEVSLDNFQGDSKVNFDVYVYLPQNARFVLYTPQGGTLYESQKQKLMNDGIRTVHIHKRSFDEVRRQRTRETLEESAAVQRVP